MHEHLVVLVVDALDLRVADDLDVALLQAGAHGVCDLVVLAFEDGRPALQNGHLRAEIGVQRGELEPDEPSTDDDQLTRQRLHVDEGAARVDARAVGAGDGRQLRRGAAVDEHAISRERAFAFV